MSHDVLWNTFSETEQARLLRAPLWTFLWVAAADGSIDRDEVEAFLGVVNHQRAFGSDLLGRVITELTPRAKALFDEVLKSRAETRPEQAMQAVANSLDTRLSEDEARLFKVGLLKIGLRVAEASRGVGRERIQPEETTTLEHLAQALRVELA